MSDSMEVRPRIRDALRSDRPVVALESTVLTHGLPHPENVKAAERQVAAVRASDAVDATVGVVRGSAVIGLSRTEWTTLCEEGARKVSSHTVAIAVATGASAGTTVAATAALACRAGIEVMSTGGIGGVHPGGRDISADLVELSRTPMLVVCSGPKSILDVAATREALESLSVPVLGWGTDELPAFFSARSGLPVDQAVDGPAQVADVWRAHRSLGRPGAVLLCVPPPRSVASEEVAKWMGGHEGSGPSYEGGGRTPRALDRVRERSGGEAVRLNLELLEENARVAGAVAREMSR